MAEAKEKAELEKQKQQKHATKPVKILPSRVIEIENLPENYSRLMLEEMIKSYPGVEGILEADGPSSRAVIEFNSPDSAKFAVVGLNRLKVDQSGRELKVKFVQKQP